MNLDADSAVSSAEATLDRGNATVIVATDYQGVESSGVQEFDSAFESTPSDFMISDKPKEWTARLQKEFEHLADKVIDEDISEKDRHRFETLTLWRRALVSPRTLREILFEEESLERLAVLTEALQNCVRFHEVQS